MNKATADTECQRYLEDPEANAAHLQTCAECRAVSAALAEKSDVKPASIDVNALPLAPWEGSSHRPWPLVLGITAVVVAIALALCDAAGLSPLHVAESSLTSMEAMRGLIDRATASLRSASLVWQIAFGAAFVIVNALLIVLLRRSPRGMDA
jgi:predicted anti-sigma-YlaC factor YlaD